MILYNKFISPPVIPTSSFSVPPAFKILTVPFTFDFYLLRFTLHFTGPCGNGNNSTFFFFLLKPIFHTRISFKDFLLAIYRYSKSSVSELRNFLWKKENIHVKTPYYSFLFLVIWRQYPFATIIHFSMISYPTSMILPSKNSMMESF